MIKDIQKNKINEIVFEVRYKENTKILDHRGSWTDDISLHMNLHHWQINTNRIDVYEEDLSRRVFISYRNAGMLIQNSPNKDYFPEQAIKYLSFFFSRQDFNHILNISRIGVRARYATSYDGRFEDLLQKFISKIIKPTEYFVRIISGEIIDAGAPINFKNELGNINSNSRPMKREQLFEFFKDFNKDRKDSFPSTALYFDVDIWSNTKSQKTPKQIIDFLRKASDYSWDIHENFDKFVLHENGENDGEEFS